MSNSCRHILIAMMLLGICAPVTIAAPPAKPAAKPGAPTQHLVTPPQTGQVTKPTVLPGTKQPTPIPTLAASTDSLPRWAEIYNQKIADMEKAGVTHTNWNRIIYIKRENEINGFFRIEGEVEPDSSTGKIPSLKIQGNPVPIKENRFSFPVYLDQKLPYTKYPVEVIQPSGTTKLYDIYARPFKDKRFIYQKYELAFTYISYLEIVASPAATYSYSSLSLTARASATMNLGTSPFDIGLTAYFTLFPITKSLATTTARFLGLNLRMGYGLGFVKPPFSIRVMLGAYYTTMFVSDDSFGFLNMMGPQLFPVISYTLKNGNSVSLFVKWSPISAGGFSLNFLSYELASGLSYSIEKTPKNRFTIDVIYSRQFINSGGVTVDSQSVSLGGGIAL